MTAKVVDIFCRMKWSFLVGSRLVDVDTHLNFLLLDLCCQIGASDRNISGMSLRRSVANRVTQVEASEKCNGGRQNRLARPQLTKNRRRSNEGLDLMRMELDQEFLINDRDVGF